MARGTRTQVKARSLKLEDIYNALTPDQLTALYRDSFDPNETVEVTYTIEVSIATDFIEDFIRDDAPRRKRRKRQKGPPEPPSVVHGKAYNAWMDKVDCGDDADPDASVVFGRYLMLYRSLFGEEDPNWAGQRPTKAIFVINKFANDLTNGDFKPLIEFLNKLMPLWAKRLKRGESFPSFRPDIDTLFVRRKFWAQRYNHYTQWKKEKLH